MDKRKAQTSEVSKNSEVYWNPSEDAKLDALLNLLTRWSCGRMTGCVSSLKKGSFKNRRLFVRWDYGGASGMPNLYVIGGPNGAGKTTFARSFLTPFKPSPPFVNADLIATELSPSSPDAVAIQAGRLMIQRMDELAQQGIDFAIESTLAAKTLAARLAPMKASGYRIHLMYLWLSRPELAIARVAERVRRGGHHIADETVRRRYDAGLRNLFRLYLPLADEWAIYDNSSLEPNRIAYGSAEGIYIENPHLYQQIERMAQP